MQANANDLSCINQCFKGVVINNGDEGTGGGGGYRTGGWAQVNLKF